MTSSYKRDWVQEDKERVLRMERLYVLDGRHRKDHPMNGLYTGLHAKADELEADLAE